VVEQAAREAVAEVDNGRREGKRDDGNEGLEADEADGKKQGDVLADVEARQEGYMERHAAQMPSGVCRRQGTEAIKAETKWQRDNASPLCTRGPLKVHSSRSSPS